MLVNYTIVGFFWNQIKVVIFGSLFGRYLISNLKYLLAVGTSQQRRIKRSPLLICLNVLRCPYFSNILARQALFLPLEWFSQSSARKTVKVINVCKFLTSYCIFFILFRWITVFLGLNIIHVNCRLTYQLFWIKSKSSAGGSYLVWFFTFD